MENEIQMFCFMSIDIIEPVYVIIMDLEGIRMGIAANSMVPIIFCYEEFEKFALWKSASQSEVKFTVSCESIESGHVKINYSQWRHIQNVSTERTEYKTCKTNSYSIMYFNSFYLHFKSN